MINKELETKFNLLFKNHVPTSGAAATLEGEFLRAAGRIAYRYFNDGDWWCEGYGTETVGPAITFLSEKLPTVVWNDIEHHLDTPYGNDKAINAIVDRIYTYVISVPEEEYKEFNGDMHDYTPLIEDIEDDYDY